MIQSRCCYARVGSKEGGVKSIYKKDIQDLAQFLKEKEILLIIDEVQSGVYRSGEF